MKKYHIIFLFLLVIIPCSAKKTLDGERIIYSMNTDWAFLQKDDANGFLRNIDDSSWQAITLPHIMQLEKKNCGGDEIYKGIAWYRRYFKIPKRYKGKRIVISFEGVMKNCVVYLNGKKLTAHYGGYLGFVVDLSQNISWDETNVLAVRVTAEDDPLTPPGKPQSKMDFYYYSGIYRDVKMVISNNLFITNPLEGEPKINGGQKIFFTNVSEQSANVRCISILANNLNKNQKIEVIYSLMDKEEKQVAKISKHFNVKENHRQKCDFQLSVQKPHLWFPDNPYLYRFVTTLKVNDKVVDEISKQIGIRTIRYDNKEGFFINDQHVYLRGGNRHESFPYVGDAVSNSMQERDVIELKHAGFNAVRAAHYPQDPAFLDACDRYGLLVIECIPGWQFYNPDFIFVARLKGMLRQMIRRDCNRPSVILWEIALNESRYPTALAKDLFEIAHQEYPGDQLYTAGDYFGNTSFAPYFDVFYKQVARFPKDGDVMTNTLDNQIEVKPLLTREWGDGVGEKPRVSIAENEEELYKQCRGRFNQLIGNGYFDWCMLDANPRMAGHFLWSYNDYARGSVQKTMYCGIVDINRFPKPSYYMMKSMQSPLKKQKGLSVGPMIYIASRNSKKNYFTSTTEIPIFSNCDSVALFRNSKLIGTTTREANSSKYQAIVNRDGSPCYIFDAKNYEAGTLEAFGYINGRKVVSHKVITPEKADRIKIVVNDEGISPQADGSDLIPIYFIVVDENGTRIANRIFELTINVKGEGTLVGNQMPRTGINPQKTEGGIAFAFVRTSQKSGKIRIHAQSEGLLSAETTVRTIVTKQKKLPIGEKRIFKGQEIDYDISFENLDGDISTKEHLHIASVETGSSQENYPVKNCIDGDDTSWWISNSDDSASLVFSLDKVLYVKACRILFQKDSSSYKHHIEYSKDGEKWDFLCERNCTGWDFKPIKIGKSMKYLRLTINEISEGRAGLSEVTFY